MGCSHSSPRSQYDELPNVREARPRSRPATQEDIEGTYMCLPTVSSKIEQGNTNFVWNTILNWVYPVTEGYATEAELWTEPETDDGHMVHTVWSPHDLFTLFVVECRVPHDELSGSERESGLHVAYDIMAQCAADSEPSEKRRMCAVTSVAGRVDLYEWDWDLVELTRVNQTDGLGIGNHCATITAFLTVLRRFAWATSPLM